jgi:hypothetical protein
VTSSSGLETDAPAAQTPQRAWWQLRSSTGPDVPGALSDRLPRPWLFPLIAFAASWLLIVAAWFGSDWLHGQSHPWTWHFLFKDAGWYLDIAERGYPATLLHLSTGTVPPATTAFFPLFPKLIRFMSYLTGGNYPVAGLIVSVLTGAASAVAVWALAGRVCGRRVADLAVLLFCLFPGALTFGMLYSDPLGVAIGAAALLALLDRRWLLAGIIGAAGTAEASPLIILAGVSGIVALQAIWSRHEWRALLAPALTPLGMLAFFGYLGHRYHDYAFWFQVERDDWHQHIDWGAQTLHIILWTDPGARLYPLISAVYVIMLIAALAGIVMMIAARLPLPLSLFGVLMVLTFVISPATPRPRAVWFAFPLFIGAAAKLPRVVYWPVLALSAAGLVFLTGWWPYHVSGPAP